MARALKHEHRNRDRLKASQGTLDADVDGWAPLVTSQDNTNDGAVLFPASRPDVVRISAAQRILSHAARDFDGYLHIEGPIRAEIETRFRGDPYAWARAVAKLWQRLSEMK